MIQGMIQTWVDAAATKAEKEGIPMTPFTEHASAYAQSDASPKPQLATSQNFTAGGSWKLTRGPNPYINESVDGK